jgi:Tfp pilus assembly PilM family ATPase
MNWRALVASASPRVAVGIAPDRVTAITLGRAGGVPAVTAHASEALPPGAVEASLTAPNFADPARVVAALRTVFDRLGQRPRRLALALPDTVGKVSLLRFDKVPARADDLDQLIRFQVRKAAPFRLEDAQVTYSPGAPLDGGGREYVVVVARRDVVKEYEDACVGAGAQAGLVDLATLNVINAVLTRSDRRPGDWLLVHVTSHCATVAILRDGHLIFYRTRGDEADGNLAGLVHQTAMYYEDRLGGSGFSKVLLVGGAAAYSGMESGDWLRRNLQERLRSQVDVVGPDAVRFSERIGVDAATVDAYMPLVGLLTRTPRV